jgi:hypothetical protein
LGHAATAARRRIPGHEHSQHDLTTLARLAEAGKPLLGPGQQLRRIRARAQLFNPCGGATWLLTEIDPDDETVAWGLCDLGMGFPEFGTVSLTELAGYRGRLGLGIERDLHFEARGPISVYIDAASKAGRIVENIRPFAS